MHYSIFIYDISLYFEKQHLTSVAYWVHRHWMYLCLPAGAVRVGIISWESTDTR